MWKIVSHNSIQSFWINIRSDNFQSIDKTFYYFPNANKTVYMVFHLICCNWVKCFLTVFNTFKALGLTMYNFKFYQFPSILDFLSIEVNVIFPLTANSSNSCNMQTRLTTFLMKCQQLLLRTVNKRFLSLIGNYSCHLNLIWTDLKHNLDIIKKMKVDFNWIWLSYLVMIEYLCLFIDTSIFN